MRRNDNQIGFRLFRGLYDLLIGFAALHDSPSTGLFLFPGLTEI